MNATELKNLAALQGTDVREVKTTFSKCGIAYHTILFVTPSGKHREFVKVGRTQQGILKDITRYK